MFEWPWWFCRWQIMGSRIAWLGVLWIGFPNFLINVMRRSEDMIRMIRRIGSDSGRGAEPKESFSTWGHIPPSIAQQSLPIPCKPVSIKRMHSFPFTQRSRTQTYFLTYYNAGRVLTEYCERMREMGMQLLRGISKSLGLEECYIENKMKLESGYSVFGPNYYPALSQSSDDKNQIGQFPHRDPGLLVLLAQNVGGGLQIEHQKKWLNADFPPSSIFVIVADHMEVRLRFSNF